MKSLLNQELAVAPTSSPVWEAWIEIYYSTCVNIAGIVSSPVWEAWIEITQ